MEGHDEIDDCTPCVAGKYSETRFMDSDSACKDCPDGWGAAGEDRWFCHACPAGYYKFRAIFDWNVGTPTNDCAACPPGRFQDEQQMHTCKLCSSGQYVDYSGGSQCVSCPGGYFSESDRVDCGRCALGKYSAGAGTMCELCLPGTYADEEGLTTCKDCAAGTFVTNVGASVCNSCATGAYQDEEASHLCTVCPGGYYENEESSTACKQCPAATPDSAPGTTSSLLCFACSAGRFSSGAQCVGCPQGWYKPTGDTSCTQCPYNLMTADTGSTSEDACGCTQHQRYTGSQCEACPASSYRSLDAYHRDTRECQTTSNDVAVKLYHNRGSCSGITGWLGYNNIGSGGVNVDLNGVVGCWCSGNCDTTLNDRVAAIVDVTQPWNKRAKFTFYGDSDCTDDEKSHVTIGCDGGLKDQSFYVWLLENGHSLTQPNYDGGSSQLGLSCMKIELVDC